MQNVISVLRRVRAIRATALSVVLAGAMFVPSYAAPDVPPTVPDQPAVPQAATPQALADVPGAEYLPPLAETALQAGAVPSSQVTVANRLRMAIELGPDNPIWAILYNGEFNVPVGSEHPTDYTYSCSQNPDSPPCVPFPYQPKCATDDLATQAKAQYVRNRLYPIRPLEGGGADVGFLGETRVNMVAFGSVPASATLTLRVPVVDGKVQYLVNHMWTNTSGTGDWRDSCDPGFASSVPQQVALVEGKTNIWISDLMVDGEPVDVGAQCRTAHPAELELWGDTDRGGYYPLAGGGLGAEPGLMPHAFTVDGPQFRKQNGRTFGPSKGLDVPPFTGCGTGGDDLSPLVTAMASGSDNPVRVRQDSVTLTTPGEVPIEDPTACSSFYCPQPPDVPELPPLPWEDGETP